MFSSTDIDYYYENIYGALLIDDIAEDPETPCEWITRSIKDVSKR